MTVTRALKTAPLAVALLVVLALTPAVAASPGASSLRPVTIPGDRPARLLGTAGPATASSSSSPVLVTFTALRSLRDDRCLDEDKSSLPTHDGTKVQVWSCSGQSNQLWQLWNDSTIRSTYDGRCLDADVSGAIQDGTKVQVWTCTGADNQRWTVDPDGEIESSLVDNDLNSFVLDEDTSGGSHDGAKVQIWHATGASNQSWYSRIRGVSDGRCLDEDVSSTTHDGTKVQMWTCTGSSNQRWVLLQDGAIVNRHDSRCLDADVSSPLHAGTKVQVWSCTFDAINPYVHVYNQRWLHHLNFTFLPDSVLDTFCLDEDKSSTLHDGIKVQLWSCSSQANQQWNTW